MSFEKQLELSKGDVAHKVIKTALASVPLAGNVLSELFTTVVTEPSSRRRDNILIKFDSRLRLLEEKQIDINKLASNESFLSIVLQAYQIAMRTHQEEKIEALANAITNSALIDIEENLEQMFLTFIDSFTEWHLRILIFLNNPVEVLRNMNATTDYYMGSVSQVLETAYSALTGRTEFTKQVVRDLYNRGLINTDATGLFTMMSGSGMVASRTTDMGKIFIQFITEYK